MHQESPHSSSFAASPDAARLVLGLARQLHKAALSDSLAVSLPVLRRLLVTGTLRDITLPELSRQRAMVRRKHILRMLAMEAGRACWEDYRQALDVMPAQSLSHFDLLRTAAGYPNLWFSTDAEARQHVRVQGGRVVPVGSQAVVIDPRQV